MVNEIPISKHLRRWLGLPPSFTTIGLCGQSTKLQMPFSSLVEENKVAKVRLLLTLRYSKDEKISGAGIEIRTGRKWSVSQATELAESSLKHQDIVGTTTRGREGLDSKQQQRWKDSDKTQRRSMIQTEERKEDYTRTATAVQLGSQGKWTIWNLPERKLTWQELWNYEPLQLSFLLRSVYDMLPSPTNFKLWKLSEVPSCPLCENIGSLCHILSSCPTALSQGRYRWRHDQVLRVMADILEKERKKERPLNRTGPQFINVVREGENKSTTSIRTGIIRIKELGNVGRPRTQTEIPPESESYNAQARYSHLVKVSEVGNTDGAYCSLGGESR